MRKRVQKEATDSYNIIQRFGDGFSNWNEAFGVKDAAVQDENVTMQWWSLVLLQIKAWRHLLPTFLQVTIRQSTNFWLLRYNRLTNMKWLPTLSFNRRSHWDIPGYKLFHKILELKASCPRYIQFLQLWGSVLWNTNDTTFVYVNRFNEITIEINYWRIFKCSWQGAAFLINLFLSLSFNRSINNYIWIFCLSFELQHVQIYRLARQLVVQLQQSHVFWEPLCDNSVDKRVFYDTLMLYIRQNFKGLLNRAINSKWASKHIGPNWM